jgi:hypothetical protein
MKDKEKDRKKIRIKKEEFRGFTVSAKFADRGFRVVSVTDPHDR